MKFVFLKSSLKREPSDAKEKMYFSSSTLKINLFNENSNFSMINVKISCVVCIKYVFLVAFHEFGLNLQKQKFLSFDIVNV